MDRDRQRRLGAWYTPPALVDFVLGRALAATRTGERVRILDPSCGDGRFLAAAGAALGARAELFGIDLDPGAVAAARAAVPGATIVEGDALARDWSGQQFDLVIGNPPFLGQMASRTSRGGRSSLGGGAYADTAALFLALSARLVRPGGAVALVLPQSVLATRDAGPIRAAVASGAALTDLWVAGESVFEAAVHTVVTVFVRDQQQESVRRWFGPAFTPVSSVSIPAPDEGLFETGLAAHRSWSFLAADLAGVPSVSPKTRGVLGDIASITADFRDQYYGLVGAVGDDVDGPKLITSGLIDAGVCLWGSRSTRFAKVRYTAPRVDVSALSPALQSWAATRLVPKVLLATQTKVIEAIADADGTMLPSVPVISIVPNRPDYVWRVLAVLLAPSTSAWAMTRYLGAGMTSTALKLSATQARTLPLPAQLWDTAVAPLQAGDMRQFAREMNRAYAVPDDPVTDWWLARI